MRMVLTSKHRRWLGFTLMTAMVLSLNGCSLMKKPESSVNGASGTSQSSAPSVQTDPKVLKSMMEAGNAKAKAGQWQEAIAAFQKIIDLNPGYGPAHVQIGWAHAELKQWDQAKQHLIQAIAASPDNAAAHANLAWVHAEQKHWNEAQQEAKRAIDLDPNNPYAHATLAWAYQETHQDQLAIAEYEKSLELKPDLENSHFAVGMAYCNQGITVRTQEHLDKLTQMHSSKAPTLQARLSKGCFPKK